MCFAARVSDGKIFDSDKPAGFVHLKCALSSDHAPLSQPIRDRILTLPVLHVRA